MIDYDTRVDAYLEQQVHDAVDEALRDRRCHYRGCENLAAHRGVLFPCFDMGEFCDDHREAIMRTRAFQLKAHGYQNCLRCGQRVDDVHWESIE